MDSSWHFVFRISYATTSLSWLSTVFKMRMQLLDGAAEAMRIIHAC